MTISEKIKFWLVPYLIKTNLLQEEKFTLTQLNKSLDEYLPFNFKIKVPNGIGNIKVLQVKLSESSSDKGFIKACLSCLFDIHCLNEHIFSANIEVDILGKPSFLKDKAVIRGENIKMGTFVITNENLVMVKQTKSKLSTFYPSIIDNILSLTVGSVLTSIDDIIDVKSYMSLFVNQSTQHILAMHRTKIENELFNSFDNGDIQFRLENCFFEEKVFAAYGKDIIVRDQHLVCRF